MTASHTTNGHSQTDSGSSQSAKFPRKVTVAGIVRSRYANNHRPLHWEDRKEGVDVVTTDDGESVKLLCNGGQSTPRKGWVLMLTDGSAQAGYNWTLYGYATGADL